MISQKQMKAVSVTNGLDRTAVCTHMPRSRSGSLPISPHGSMLRCPGKHTSHNPVTSPAAGDGKSTLALNLSISLAMSGKRTVLVESDFRRPKVHKLTGVNDKRGIVGTCFAAMQS